MARHFIFIISIALLLATTSLDASKSTENKSAVPCNPDTDTDCSFSNCQEVCGCDRAYIFDEEKAECVLNIAYLKEIMLAGSKNYVSSEDDMYIDDGLSTKIRERVDKVFKGIIASAIFFVICCSVCVITVLIFCCHIRRSDRKLKNEVDALAKKMKVDIRKKESTNRKPDSQIGESCNVVVEDANIMCV